MGSSSPTISIDVLKDLSSTSALQSMLSSQQGAIFQILGELQSYAAQPVKAAAAAKASASVSLTASANWKTSNGIGFSLTPTAKCSISVDTVSETFQVAMNIESTDPQNTENVVAGPMQWNEMLKVLTDIMTNDIYLDYGQPTAAALLTLCSEGGVQVSSSVTETQDSSSLTCLVTVA